MAACSSLLPPTLGGTTGSTTTGSAAPGTAASRSRASSTLPEATASTSAPREASSAGATASAPSTSTVAHGSPLGRNSLSAPQRRTRTPSVTIVRVSERAAARPSFRASTRTSMRTGRNDCSAATGPVLGLAGRHAAAQPGRREAAASQTRLSSSR